MTAKRPRCIHLRLKEGEGVYIWGDGSSYEGQLKDNQVCCNYIVFRLVYDAFYLMLIMIKLCRVVVVK